MSVAEGEVELAFGLVCAAGASTGLGAAMVFSDRCINLANKKFLAGCLGISAGVMLYVSFVEIFVKSYGAYAEEHEDKKAYLYATLTFFSGFGLCGLMNKLVHCLDPEGLHHGSIDVHDHKKHEDVDLPIPGEDLEAAISEKGACCDKDHDKDHDKKGQKKDSAIEPPVDEELSGVEKENKVRLQKMGLMTALAIGLHNFPEGLATFVATLDDPAVGASLAVAIGIHNIPEGLCVAIPVYYATGNRWKAFGWAMLSGVSEPIGAGLGWLVLSNVMTQNLYGFLFGLVGGMMVAISVGELIPTAHRYDPHDEVTTKAVIAGMAIMAVSLVLFVA
jgi:ZIP family zinc transporter